jgi:hypothetical protein
MVFLDRSIVQPDGTVLCPLRDAWVVADACARCRRLIRTSDTIPVEYIVCDGHEIASWLGLGSGD